jgi:alpha-L-fucosidase 2
MGPTMDIEIVSAVLSHFIDASTLLDADPDLRHQADAARKRLPPIPISPEGRLQEWPVDYEETELGHRHLSHLWALYPGNEITLRGTPDLAQAARNSLERRIANGGGSTGWSRAWIVNLWARLEEGDKARFHLKELLRLSTKPNLFDVCGEKPTSYYQIDGNLGAPAGILEMLLQSHSGVLRFLPALPAAWPAGSMRGIRARGGLEVDMTWKDGKVIIATLRATSDGKRSLAAAKGQRIASVTARSRKINLEAGPLGEMQFHATAGETYRVAFTEA